MKVINPEELELEKKEPENNVRNGKEDISKDFPDIQKTRGQKVKHMVTI